MSRGGATPYKAIHRFGFGSFNEEPFPQLMSIIMSEDFIVERMLAQLWAIVRLFPRLITALRSQKAPPSGILPRHCVRSLVFSNCKSSLIASFSHLASHISNIEQTHSHHTHIHQTQTGTIISNHTFIIIIITRRSSDQPLPSRRRFRAGPRCARVDATTATTAASANDGRDRLRHADSSPA